MRIKNFCAANGTIKKVEPKEWVKILTNHISDKRWYLENIKNSLNNKKITIKKWVKHLNRHFSEDTQMTHKHVKRCLTSLNIKEVQIKTTVRYHSPPVRMAVIKKT